MPYPSSNLRSYAKRVVSSAARTSSSNSGALKLPKGKSYALSLNCSAASGTSPTLDVFVNASFDGGTTFIRQEHFAQLTAASLRNLVFGASGELPAASEAAVATGATARAVQFPLTRDYQIEWVIGGTNPSFTFSVDLYVEPF